ncbi:protein kinase frk1 [Datura stramonium]|uniref:Protein kinase frk1 n=1 Tax=Datura stramonium TaxID=4076 RepID=A0ABS8S0P7_DATST|nr:protein kinase frk1 [Datura stramonium]
MAVNGSGFRFDREFGEMRSISFRQSPLPAVVTRLGGKSAFVGKLGDDEFGHMSLILKQNGVKADGIFNFDKGARTALASDLRADGEREFMFYRNPSADMLLTPGRVESLILLDL